MTTTLEQVTKQIEQLMKEHVAGVQLAAMQAIARAIAGQNRIRERKSGSHPRTSSHRRTESELALLSERLYETVKQKPGELMAVYAAALNSSANELQMPMRRLRNKEWIRSVGEKYRTRYFPTGPI